MTLYACAVVQVLRFAQSPSSQLTAQVQSGETAAARAAAQAPLPPATKLEGFKPAAGSIVTLGYTDLGKVSGVAVDVREQRDVSGNTVRGLLVDVTESQYRRERSFVDADEIPELIRGLDALLQIRSNPTQFKNFEVRYTTRGELELIAFNNTQGGIQYAVKAGRPLTAQRFLDRDDMQKFRGMVARALGSPSDGSQSRTQVEPSRNSGNQAPPGTNWVADTKTRTYYAVECAAARDIADADRLYYGTESSVKAAGFRRANEC